MPQTCFAAISSGRSTGVLSVAMPTPPAVRALLGALSRSRCRAAAARHRRSTHPARASESAELATLPTPAAPRSAGRVRLARGGGVGGAALVAVGRALGVRVSCRASRQVSADVTAGRHRWCRSAVDRRRITRDGTRHRLQGRRRVDRTQLFVDRSTTSIRTIDDAGLPKGPFMSPDGRWVGYFEPVDGGPVLKKVAIRGGPSTVCHVDGASRGATWADDRTIMPATGRSTRGCSRRRERRRTAGADQSEPRSR